MSRHSNRHTYYLPAYAGGNNRENANLNNYLFLYFRYIFGHKTGLIFKKTLWKFSIATHTNLSALVGKENENLTRSNERIAWDCFLCNIKCTYGTRSIDTFVCDTIFFFAAHADRIVILYSCYN